MLKSYFKKTLIYIVGLIIVAFGVALHTKHNLGNGPLDQFNSILADIFNTDLGTTTIILGLVVILIYFIKNKNKDIVVSIIAILLFGYIINFVLRFVINDLDVSSSNLFIRILILLIAVNLTSIGVIIMLSTKISLLTLEMLVILLNELKVFKKLNFGQVRMILDVMLILFAVLLNLIFLPFDILTWPATVALVFIGGPLMNYYLKIYNKFVLNHSNTTNN